MESRYEFQKRVDQALSQIDPEVLSYDPDEYWMIQAPYEFIEYYAAKKRLFNTAIALPLCRGVHNGTHRKASITKDGKSYRLPYVIHCLMVCHMLANVHIAISHDEEDVLLAAALCHDMIEDVPFPDHGKELITEFHLDPMVYELVRLLSKRKDFTKEEELAHFHGIESNPLSLLIKLSDRGNNVEDLYNMSSWKVHEYVGETREYFMPMVAYGVEHYPRIVTTLEILRDKIVTLTEVAEIMVNRYEERERELIKQRNELQEENRRLRQEWRSLWKNEDDTYEEGGKEQ